MSQFYPGGHCSFAIACLAERWILATRLETGQIGSSILRPSRGLSIGVLIFEITPLLRANGDSDT